MYHRFSPFSFIQKRGCLLLSYAISLRISWANRIQDDPPRAAAPQTPTAPNGSIQQFGKLSLVVTYPSPCVLLLFVSFVQECGITFPGLNQACAIGEYSHKDTYIAT